MIIFITTETLNTINSRTLVLASYGGGKLTVKCPSLETLRYFSEACWTLDANPHIFSQIALQSAIGRLARVESVDKVLLVEVNGVGRRGVGFASTVNVPGTHPKVECKLVF